MPHLAALKASSGWCRSQHGCLDTREAWPGQQQELKRSGTRAVYRQGGKWVVLCWDHIHASRSSGLGGNPQKAREVMVGIWALVWWGVYCICREEREVEVKSFALPGLLWWRCDGKPSQGCEVRLVRVKMLCCAQQAHKQQDECRHESACKSHTHRHGAVVSQPTAWLAEPLKINDTRTNILCAWLILKARAKWLAYTVLRCTLLIPLVTRKCYWLQMVTERIAQYSPYM